MSGQTYGTGVSTERVVEMRSGLSGFDKLLYIFLIIAIVLMSTLILSRYGQINKYNYQLQQLQIEIQDLKDRNQQLLYEKEQLSNQERIISFAESKGLKMGNGTVKVLTSNPQEQMVQKENGDVSAREFAEESRGADE
ncbi:cell division protein FtsL [Rubeoparvulum massiliense]|uniref:cell division protein FtsL n=1 Tax=Rubeoparvulum massiliense TaxID=1631346 RepID=UPI00065E7683|nr:cell division protein FtsL [Rubeoparvulum massiliense]